MLRFEKLGLYDYAVYVDGEADAIGKAGILCGESWFLARKDLGGALTWGKTMNEAVSFWAENQLRCIQLRKRIKREAKIAIIQKAIFPEVFKGENE